MTEIPDSSDSTSVGTKITLAESMRSFAESLSALRDFVDVVASVLDERQRKFAQEHRAELIPLLVAINRVIKDPRISSDDAEKLEKEIGGQVKVTAQEKGGVKIQIEGLDDDTAEQFVEALKGVKSSTGHQALLYRSALISLISSAEWFLSQVIRQHLVLHSEAGGTREKVLSLEDLRSLGSIEEAKRYLIDSRIDELMWGGFDDWFAHLTEKVKLSLGYVKENKKEIIEVFQRRNVMVHNNGITHSS
jgi:hypothetical protein